MGKRDFKGPSSPTKFDEVDLWSYSGGLLKFFTDSEFQGEKLNSYYPLPKEFTNYVAAEFEKFMDDQIKEWVANGALEEWDKVRGPGAPFVPVAVSPLGVEPSKPRALWDGRYVNEFCRDVPFSKDNASKVAEVAWGGVYFFQIDHNIASKGEITLKNTIIYLKSHYIFCNK